MSSSERREQVEGAAAAWIARRECDGWSKTDQAALAQWLGQSLDHRVAWLRLNAAWDQARHLKPVGRLAFGNQFGIGPFSACDSQQRASFWIPDGF